MRHYAENLSTAGSINACASLRIVPAEPDSSNGITNQTIRRSCAFFRKLTHRLKVRYSVRFHQALAKTLVDESAPDIVHFVNKIPLLPTVVKVLDSYGVRSIYTIHDPVAHQEYRSRWGKTMEWYYRNIQIPSLLNNCAAIHVHAHSHKQILLDLYGKDLEHKIYVVQHGAGLTAPMQNGDCFPKELEQLRSDCPTLLFFGRIEPYKGLPLLIQSLRLLSQRSIDFQLIIAGAGTIDDLNQLEPKNFIVLNRFIEDNEIKAVFDKCHVVVLPYIAATQSGVVPLAYMFKKPVVVTNTGAIAELVEDGVTGLVVPPGKVSKLADAIARMIADLQLSALWGEAAYEYAENHLSMNVIATQHLDKYRELIGYEVNSTRRDSKRSVE